MEIEKEVFEKCDIINDYLNLVSNQTQEITNAFNNYITKSNNQNLLNIPYLDKKLSELNVDFDSIDKVDNEYPYIKNYLLPRIITIDKDIINQSYSIINRYYFFFLILSKESEYFGSIKNSYQNLIETNLFSIPTGMNSILTPETVKSKGFKKFTFALANWHAKSEILILYLSLMNYYYALNIDFSFNSTSVDKNLDDSIKLFSKQNLLKLGSYICKKFTAEPGMNFVNQNKLILFFSTALSLGINISGMFQFSIVSLMELVVNKPFFKLFIGKNYLYSFNR